MKLSSRERSELLATLIADHGAGLACLQLGDLGLCGSILFILRALASFFALDLVQRPILVLLEPFECSLDCG